MKVTRSWPLALSVSLAALVPACNKDDDLSGSYLGVAQFTITGFRLDFEIRAAISHSGSSLSGSYTARQVAPVPGASGSGSLSGTVNGSAVTLNLMPSSAADCPARFDATSGGDRLTGTVTLLNCGVPASGPLELVKQ